MEYDLDLYEFIAYADHHLAIADDGSLLQKISLTNSEWMAKVAADRAHIDRWLDDGGR